MPSPAARLLDCLEALQDRPSVTGPELAARLGVDPRTVRRYVAALQDLGIPVAGERGVGGGYQLQPGYRLPPLMLDDDEAAAVVLGLLAARRAGIDAAGPAADRALAKVQRVLPDRLRGRVASLAATTATTERSGGGALPAAILLDLADAISRGRRITCRYTRHDGTSSRREISPFGLVAHGDRWYLAAHDHERDALRTYRADRVRDVALGGAAARPPEAFDAAAHVRRALAEVPWTWAVRVVLDLPLDQAATRIAPTLGSLEADGGERTVLRMRVAAIDYAARVLAGLDCAFTVEEPEELRAELRVLAGRLEAGAGAGAAERGGG